MSVTPKHKLGSVMRHLQGKISLQLPAVQAGEYAYYADPYVRAHRGENAKMGKEAPSKQPFKAACHSKFAGTFARIKVCSLCRMLTAVRATLGCLACIVVLHTHSPD